MSAGRGYFTDREWRECFEAQGEKCAHCPNTDGPFEADHSTPNAWQAGKPDQILCKRCHGIKTRADRKKMAKANRISGKTPSRWNGDKPVRKIASRGFRKSARTRDQIMGERNA